MTSLADIRARLAAQESKKTGQGARTQDNAIYPHWNMEEGTTASIRFLPDADSKNTFFWVERQIIKLPFNGVKGDSSVKQIQVQVPCVEMYGDNCPILAEVRPWYKDEGLKDMANKYWKKRSYLFQGFVRQNPIGNDVTPANPIRRFVISPQIFTIIKSSLMDPEMENIPTDYVKGFDFNVKKSSKGGYADYSTSTWARKDTALTEAEQAAIEAHGLFNLADFLPKKPSESELRIIKEMFEASVDGKPYDNDKWGAYYRPYGLNAPEGDAGSDVPAPSASTASTPKSNDDEPTQSSQPVDVPKVSTSDKTSPQDILAMIRARKS
jgi:hypothetical protein